MAAPVLVVDENDHQVDFWVADAGGVINLAVTNAATPLPANARANRKSVRIWNTSAVGLYVGYTNAVKAGAPVAGDTQGILIPAGGVTTFTVSEDCPLWGITVGAGPYVIQVEEIS